MVATADFTAAVGVDRRRRWPWLAAMVVVVLLAAGIPTAIWFAHWRSSLHSLVEYPTYGIGGPVGIGDTEYFGGNLLSADVISHPRHSGELSVHISSIHPVVVVNTAGADIEVLRCVLASDGPGPLGDASGHSSCAHISAFESGDVTLGFKQGDDDIVIAVTPQHAGIVRIRGVEVRYSSGLRHGSQHAGAQIRTSTT